MAAEYSYNELVQMQEQAIRRVHEMQQRARQTARESGDIVQESEPVIQQEQPAPAVQQEHRAIARPPRSPLSGLSALIDKIPYDDDTAVLLPLILLLLHEGSDEKLILALIYIMS